MPLPLDTALLMAALRGQAQIVRRNLQEGADPSARNDEGYTALALAVIHGHPKAVTALLPVSDVNARNPKNDMDVLTLAANNLLDPTGPDVLQQVLRAGADPRATNKDGRTPLHAAAKTRRAPGTPPDEPVPEAALAAFQALLVRSDPTARDSHGITPLILAAGLGELAWLDALLTVSDPNVTTEKGWTPLMAAASQLAVAGQHMPRAERLLIAGADPCRTDQRGRSAAHVALESTGPAELFQELVERGAPIGNLVAEEPVLAWAAARVDTLFLDTVIAQDPGALSRDGVAALMNALQTGTETAIAWLEARLPLPMIGQALNDAWPVEDERVWQAMNQRRIDREQQALRTVLPPDTPTVPLSGKRSRL